VVLDSTIFRHAVWSSRGSKSMSGMRTALGISVLSLAVFPAAMAQSATQNNAASTLRVHGSATISTEPTQAQFDIGVITTGVTAKAATDQNTSQSEALIRELRAAFPGASIKGVNFSVNPVYEYPHSGAPTVSGYTANNTVRFLLNDLSKLSAVIDIAVRSGASSINRLSFAIQNENAARARTLAAAAHQAQGSAEALAESLNLKLTRLITVDEGQPVIVSPSREFSFEKLQSTNLPPISPGMIDVRADVDLTYEVKPGAAANPRKPD
jgi:uncharacterized protein